MLLFGALRVSAASVDVQHVPGVISCTGEFVPLDKLALNSRRESAYDAAFIQAFLALCDAQQEVLASLGEDDNAAISPAASSAYGAAVPYATIQTSATDINCYGYAARFLWWILPGDIAYSNGSPLEDASFPSTVNGVAGYAKDDLSRAGRTSRIIASATAPVNADEYRVAVRVGAMNGWHDFHFMIQHSDGSWSDKPGELPSQNKGMINPTSIPWPIYNADTGAIVFPNFYNSATVYLAVKKPYSW
nr:hypothetical protein [bacterium]